MGKRHLAHLGTRHAVTPHPSGYRLRSPSGSSAVASFEPRLAWFRLPFRRRRRPLNAFEVSRGIWWTIAARSRLVEGAVGMVEMALAHLSEKGVVDLDDERKAAMVSNLMVVLCSERDTHTVALVMANQISIQTRGWSNTNRQYSFSCQQYLHA